MTPHRIAAALVLLAACVAPPLESPPLASSCETLVTHPQNVRDKVDVLFLVDNSASMSPMAEELNARFPQFLKVFSDLAAGGTRADMHIGVVTSDYGAGASGAPGCQPSPGGQGGRLVDVGAFADPRCKPPLGSRFIHYAFRSDGADVHNLPPAQDLATTFTCMTSVVTRSSAGCGFEHVLESAYAALHNNLPENAGFLREDAILAVVFVTNEDDCSAPPDSALFDKSRVAEYGYLSSYRCTRFGLVCDGGPPPYGDSAGPLANCRPAPGGALFDLDRYVNFFTRPLAQGGIKAVPARDVVLVGIDAAADPVRVSLQTPDGRDCGRLDETGNPPCLPTLAHSCQNAQQPVFYGDPAVRLNSVIARAPQHAISSICAGDYSGALESVARLIGDRLVPGCLQAPLLDPALPDCVVEDVTPLGDGTTTVAPIPRCDGPGAATPCWRIETRDNCVASGGAAVAVDRGGRGAPFGTNARIACRSACQER